MSDRPNSFLSPKCEVHLTPNRGGHTVVARGAIAKGELLVVWSGTLVTGEELNSLSPTVRRYCLQVEEDQYLVSLSDCEPPDYVNHSCSPNAGLSGQIALVAMRDIAAGEEITYDYAMSDGSPYDEFACSCGSPHCRGHVSGDDWRRFELWQRYAGYFSPYLQRRIASEKVLRAVAVKRRAYRRKAPAVNVLPGE
ncbi:SET domain-containing protein-lysine N-methyltransferase [Hyphomicrobium methylovorum]|uniref:SET domain-containing protein n=1 Tax=Hyphomicrobium methylovorum TaxID=84 RepID=UPI0015E6AFBD|nr:SET domain-containing protein-lysine N-methyltransferase [Hyphomicrobium methylovorum]MBA2125390.1 SET domain-containing protein-lysine N-methyltransferase [Hyphomicrobium methylovorum]